MAEKAFDVDTLGATSCSKGRHGTNSHYPCPMRSNSSSGKGKRRYIRYHFSQLFFHFMKISFAINILSIFNLKCNLGLRVPSKGSIERILLTIPKLCRSTVSSTVSVVYGSYCYMLESEWLPKPIIPQSGLAVKKSVVAKSNESIQRVAKALKWAPLSVTAGFAWIVCHNYRRAGRSDPIRPYTLARGWEVTCYRMMPLKAVSRVWGWINNINLPLWARTPFLSWYVNTFNCKLHEAELSDLSSYKNLGEFFRRNLRDGVRPIHSSSPIVSPSDGTVLHYGKINSGRIEQVKGVSYSLSAFFGPPDWRRERKEIKERVSAEYHCTQLSKGESKSLFHCVVYLAPGDYHKFHSPVEWNVHYRRHFAGELLSVNPTIAKWISDLFSLNERAVYFGTWKHGFFSMAAVGATNVGSIKVYADKELNTNNRKLRKNTYHDQEFNTPIHVKKGELFGEFNLGSTIVLVFEAPTDFQFQLSNDGKVQVGESIKKEVSSLAESSSAQCSDLFRRSS